MHACFKLVSLVAIAVISLPVGHAAEAVTPPGIYVVGDSISTPGAWPSKLEKLTGRHVFSQAIGGTQSPSMVARARGVELVAPLANPVNPGTIHLKWSRHIADRTQDPKYRSQWAYYAKAVSEPTRIEVSQHGKPLGLAQQELKKFTTDHAASPKTLRCPGHGLAAGDRVTFLSNDPDYPADLTCGEPPARWNFSSTKLPGAVIERRVYFAANVTPDTFEIRELAKDADTLDLGGNATGSPSIECGWSFDVNYTGGPWDVTWNARTKYDSWIWLLEVSANDIPGSPVTKLTIPNTELLLKQMTGGHPRFLIVCPPSGSFADRGPGSFNWTNYYDGYMPWARKTFPDNHIDTMAIFDAQRTAKELSMLTDPKKPQHFWIKGAPTNEASWEFFPTATPDAFETWVGPGYIPLQFRAGFNDSIHPNNGGNQLIADAVAAMLKAKGW